MRALFVHGHIFGYDSKGNVYSDGKLPYKTWKRYLNHFTELKVCGRFKEIEDITNYNLSSGKNVEHIKLPALSKSLKRFKEYKEINTILTNQIKSTDLLIARLPSSYGMIAIKIARKLNKPYVIEMVGDVKTALQYHGDILGRFYAPIAYHNVKKVVSQAPYVLYVTEKYLQELYPPLKAKSVVNCSNVEISNFEDLVQIKSINRNNRIVIGTIGSYSAKYKGYETALKALKKLQDEGYNCELRVLGGGDERWILELISLNNLKNVFLDGSLPAGREVNKWISNLDIYIQPSKTEGLPRALIEAMNLAMPCTASNVGGIPELINSKLLHEPEDFERLAENIKLLINDKDFCVNESLNNHNNAKKFYTETLNSRRKNFFSAIIQEIENSN